MKKQPLEKDIDQIRNRLANIMPFALSGKHVFHLDLSVNNPELESFDILDTEQLSEYIQQKLFDNEALIARGGYGEDRLVYRRSPHFGEGENLRSIHLGLDVWCEPMTPVYAPVDAIVHSFRDNDQPGDYGPTIVLEHRIGQHILYTLYGHLCRRSLENLSVGMPIAAGEKFGEIGDVHENGQWPPHLHFQLIRDMKGNSGDFPGVSSRTQREYYFQLCPNPDLLIKE
jgi:murein DD-endopeptidase MepM/ murein hydrolase activator NlpD